MTTHTEKRKHVRIAFPGATGLEFVGLRRETEEQLAGFLKARAVLWA